MKKLPPGVGRADLIYRTGSADETPLVIVAEGEKAADAVAIAFPAARVVGTPQGAPAAPTAEALAPALNGATTVVLWPDNDKNGHEQMKKVSALVREVAPGAAVHFVQVDDLPEKYDAADLGKQQRMARIQAAVNAPPVAFVAPVASVSPGVSPHQNGVDTGAKQDVASVAWHSRGNKIWGDEFELPILAPGEPFPTAALGKFAAAVSALHDIVQAPLPICAASVLGSLSLVVQGVFDVEIDGRHEPTSLYLLTVAPSGARKSATDDVTFHAIRKYERAQQQEYLREYVEWKKNSKKTDFHDEPPRDPKITFTDGSAEAIQRDAHKAKYASRALITDEGGRLFGGYALAPDRLLSGLSVFSSLWDGRETTVRRMAEGGSYTMYSRRIMLHVQVQQLVVKKFLTDPIVASQGLLGRFMVAQIDAVPKREYKRGNVFESLGMQKLYEVHRLLLQEIVDCEHLENGGKRKSLTLTDEALSYWIVVHDGFETFRETASDDAVASFYGKAPAHVLRVAGVLAASHGEHEIALDFIRDAYLIVRWYGLDLQRAQDGACVSEDEADLIRLLTWLKRHEGETLTARDIQRRSIKAIKKGGVKKLRKFMEHLVQAGYPLKRTDEGWLIGKIGDVST